MSDAGRAALVTGGGTGLGREISRELTRRGFRVGIVYSRSEADARRTFGELREAGAEAALFHADISRPEAVSQLSQQILDRFGGLDVLVNNAAVTKFAPFADLGGVSEEEWDRIQAVNVKGPWMLSRALASALRERHGAIVNIASVAGIRPAGSSIAYAVSKAALIHLTACLAVALAPDVRVNAIAPGLFLSRWTAGFSPERIEQMTAAAPLKRTVSMEDLARMTVELALNESMTGETITVDAGIRLV